MPRTVKFSIESEDITVFKSDVVVLKYARSFHGADQAVALALALVGVKAEELQPAVGSYNYIATKSGIPSPYVIYIGTETLRSFRYDQIEAFGAKALAILAQEQPDAQHVAMTLHGVGYGLDEAEACLAEFKGFVAAIESGNVPPALEQISIVERSRGRVQRLRVALDKYLEHADYAEKQDDGSYLLAATNLPESTSAPKKRARSEIAREIVLDDEQATVPVASVSEKKPHAFIAMPFKKEMDDVFYYGIQQPLHSAGLLCERVDKDIFSGGIMEYVRNRIETAAIVIAELTGGNPNVYLEVGYAWGKGRPVILIARDEKELHFDVRGQRCLTYERIKDLEEILANELSGMIKKGIVRP